MARQFPVRLMTLPVLALVIMTIARVLDASHAAPARSTRVVYSAPVCVAVAAPHASTTIQWNAAPAIPGAQFAVVWNTRFQTHDILWANRTAVAMRLRFTVDSDAGAASAETSEASHGAGSTTGQIARRLLGPGEEESLPGATVVPSVTRHQVCVRTVRPA